MEGTLFPGPKEEKSACGVGFIVHSRGEASNNLLLKARVMSARMEHRGACSCDNLTGDGAGVMTSIPHKLFARKVKSETGIDLPNPGEYATGLIFLSEATAEEAKAFFESCARRLSLQVLTWTRPPTDPSCLGSVALSSQPFITQVFVIPLTSNDNDAHDNDKINLKKDITFEERVFFLR